MSEFQMGKVELPNEWQRVLEDAAIVRHLSFEGTPSEVLARVLAWDVMAALDPKVSSAAKALIEKGYRDGWMAGARSAVR